MTEPGGPAWRQTTFFPFALTSRLAAGEVLATTLQTPYYDTEVHGSVPMVDAVATHDSSTATSAVFLVNRSQDAEVAMAVDLTGFDGTILLDAQTLSDPDPSARNTLNNPERVGLSPNKTAVVRDSSVSVTLPPVSWTVLSLG
jgi:alpha-N-arabinofuranosidase